ncbi:MAG: TetR/AcrR family transcriptional regulator [Clostridia bacterium]|nr:TetR/AcrR family transcriptional regulator [Clostridia bacterium]MEE1055542.1 WHG domain-containing protein [Acutalibacteraceae bacterium]
MPPKIKVTKENILSAAVELVRECGAEALNARALAKKLGSSTQPIFSNYTSMEELKQEVIKSAEGIYKNYLNADMEKGEYPPYKASGMSYIRFAGEQQELFKLLFMRDRTDEQIPDSFDGINPIIEIIQRNTGLDRKAAELLHLEMWSCVHGIAVMTATGFLKLDTVTVSQMLTDIYSGLKGEKAK